MDDRLGPYRAKRDLDATPEPGAGAHDATPEPGADAHGSGADDAGRRFVVQEHHARRLHWDLRLERDGALVSWAVPKGIPQDPRENHLAVHVEDHPLDYIDFAGEIPAGNYGAGRVEIWDRGTYECHKFRDDEVIVTLRGERARGRYALFRTDGEDWMIHRMDAPADPAREPLPERVAPMLARLAELPDDDEGWAYEVKWDGVRALAFVQGGRLRLANRTGGDITRQYPEVRALGEELGARAVLLDGEVVALDELGRPSFERLQGRMHLGSERLVRRRMTDVPVTYVAFDVLHLDGRPTMGLAYERRRALLDELALEGPAWRTPAAHLGEGAVFQAATREQGLEGIMAKRLDSPYEPGRRGATWLKIKNTSRQEMVVAGWLPGEGRRAGGVGALLLGVHDEPGGELRYAGRVGTGLSEDDLARLGELLEARRRDHSPFTGRQPPRSAVFAEPDLVAEVAFGEWTSAGMIRQPSFKGLRPDKPAAEVVRERAEPIAEDAAGRGRAEAAAPAVAHGARGTPATAELEVEGRRLRLSNLDKVLYPAAGFTKGQVIDYVIRVAPVLLGHLRGRPLTLKRYPEGVEGPHFYEKQCPRHRPEWVRTASVWSRHNEREIDYCLADDLPTLVWLANLADLELHTSLALAADVTRPTMMVYDLDPGPPADVLDCARVALWVRAAFADQGLRSWVKTSGSKGLQVYVPLNTPVTYEQTKPFARALAERLERDHPDHVVSRMTKRLRPGKVLVDWSQNDEHKTTICVWSLRARAQPTVSTPVSWEEIEAACEARDPDRLVFDSAAALRRAAEHGDLFAPLLELEQRLP